MTKGKIALFLLLVCPLVSCNVCGDSVERELNSPDEKLKATWFGRDCGATTDFSTIVSLHKSTSSFKNEDNFVFVLKGREKLELLWRGPHDLTIECLTCKKEDIFKQVIKD